MSSLANGTILHDRYEILEEIGRGGFGAVYRAKDTSLNRICALKENLNDTSSANRQFHREASLLAGLNHPSLPRVTDHFRVENQGQYLVMDFIRGKSLQELMAEQDGPLDFDEFMQWMIQVTQALNYLHKRTPPIIHRDIKPANIIINGKGRAILVDFGISKMAEAGGKTTMGARAITPGFSPPEQYGVGSTDGRSDLYALGATMYACLTSKNPPESIQIMMGQETLPEPEQFNAAISRPVGDVIRQSMVLSMDGRYQTAIEMGDALKEVKDGRSAQSRPQPDSAALGAGYAPTIDPPSQPPSVSVSAPVSAPTSSAPISEPVAAPANEPAKTKNSLPIWAWAIIGAGVLVTLCAVGAGSLALRTPDDPVAAPVLEAPAEIVEDTNVSPSDSAGESAPISVDGAVAWRAGGNAGSLDEGALFENRIETMSLDSANGYLYAATNTHLLAMDTSGTIIQSTEYSGAGFLDDLEVGPDGNLYILESFAEENLIRVFDPSLRLLRAFGSRGSGEGQLSTGSPQALAFGPDGLLWALDFNQKDERASDRLIKFNPESGEIAEVVNLSADYSIADRLVQGDDGRMYMMFASDAIIAEVDNQLNIVREITVPGASYIEAAAVQSNGRIYVGVYQDQVLIQLDPVGNELARFGARADETDEGYPAGLFNSIEKIETMGDILYVIDQSVYYSYLVAITP